MKYLILILPFYVLSPVVSQAQEPLHYYSFFTNSPMEGNYFFSKTNSALTSSVRSVNNRLPVSKTAFHTPGNSLELGYVNGVNGNWQANLYRHPIRGQDHFKPANYLSLWIKVASAATKSDHLPAVQLINEDSSFSIKVPMPVTISRGWNRVLIPLENFSVDLTAEAVNTIGVVFSQGAGDGGTHLVYLDDIEFVPAAGTINGKTIPRIKNLAGYDRHVDISWEPIADTGVRYVKVYRSTDNKNFKAVGIQSRFTSRYADYTGATGKKYSYKISFLASDYSESRASPPVSVATKAMSDEALLTMVQEASFRYYWEGAETNSGLAKENIVGRKNMIASGASGFGIMALIAGTERKFITRQQAITRFKTIVQFLEKADKFHGAFSHFIDGPTGKAVPFFGNKDNGGDLVETSFLIQGLLAARSYFDGDDVEEKMIRDAITKIWKDVEWDWYRQFPDSKFLYWHWSPDQEWVINHNLIGWNETMVTYLLAIASPTHSVPASMYYTGWANQDSTGQQYRSRWGGTTDGSMYTNGKSYYGTKLDVGVSNGGPLFFTHYSYLGYDPHRITDRYTNYFTNNKNIALINHRYSKANPKNYKGYGDSCWGLTASDGPYHYSASEPVERQDEGRMAPTGAISSFPYTPVESMKALKNYYYNYGHFLWGEYGFRDAFNLTDNWCSEIYMGLNQAPMVVMIENYRTGLLWKLFMQNEDIIEGLKKLDQETIKN